MDKSVTCSPAGTQAPVPSYPSKVLGPQRNSFGRRQRAFIAIGLHTVSPHGNSCSVELGLSQQPHDLSLVSGHRPGHLSSIWREILVYVMCVICVSARLRVGESVSECVCV